MFTVIPDAVGKQIVRSRGPGATAREAAQMMTEFGISAVVVLEGQQLVGLVSERDLARRVVGGGRPTPRYWGRS